MRLFTNDGCSYFGMDKPTVIALRAELGKVTVFITEAEYNEILGAL